MIKTLAQVVAENPFDEFTDWWNMGNEFVSYMSDATCGEWTALPGNSGDLAVIKHLCAMYIHTVFRRKMRQSLVEEFIHKSFSQPLQSGEFDALSYAFFRGAFELIEANAGLGKEAIERERRQFTVRVGKIFFGRLEKHLNLSLPSGIESEADFDLLDDAIQQIGGFLKEQGYLRTHFAFSFDLDIEYAGRYIRQSREDVLTTLLQNGQAYALYEMGYPAILPSAVYLYHTMGEAQHHSSRTIEELFARVGHVARETDDFDPLGYPSDMVVELWEISKLAARK